jgi:hypothetical protein
MRAFSEELQQKYGEVNISLADGTITEPEAKEAPAMAPVE